MSEQLHNVSPEHLPQSIEREHAPEHHKPRHDQTVEKHKELIEQADALSEQAKEHAVSGKELQGLHTEKEHSHSNHTFVNGELKTMALKRTLIRVRKDLPAPARVLSKVIHQPVVDKLSSVGEKTVARPSGILFGGFTALIGTSVVLYICKQYGYSYNFLLFFVLFVGGFFAGLIFELVWRTIRRSKTS